MTATPTMYTHVATYGDFIRLSGYDELGNRVHEEIPYKPYLFMKSRNKKSKSFYRDIHKNPVDKIEFESIKAAREFVRQYKNVSGMEIFGTTKFEYLYIYDNFKNMKFERKHIRICEIDIEVGSENGYSEITSPDSEVQLITLKLNEKFYTLGCHEYIPSDPNVTYIQCKNESVLLMQFLKLWEELDFDIITGWNCEAYDMPYLVNRITMVLGSDIAKRLSPWKRLEKRKLVSFGKEVEVLLPSGISILDYIELYKKSFH